MTPQNGILEKNDARGDGLLGQLAAQAAGAPSRPGVYLMKDQGGRILYVGKAVSLKKRLQSYFQPARPHDPKTRAMVAKVVRFETILTATEKEALILESNLIKRHRPRYNVVLKDDKRYPSLRLAVKHPFPNLTVVRKLEDDGSLYFGPFSSAGAVRQTLKFIHKTFKLRKCRSHTFRNRTRPCINYQMGLCLGPCCLEVDPKVYADIVQEVIAFLRGRTPDLVKTIKSQMMAAAERQDFERAAELRDKMQALEKTLERQLSVSTDFKDRDVVAMTGRNGLLVTTLLQIRGGYLQGSRHFRFEGILGSEQEQMGLFLRQYAGRTGSIPKEILTSHAPEKIELIENYLSEQKGLKVRISTPQKGEKRRLVAMALENADNELNAWIQAAKGHRELLERLQRKLHLAALPRRIECFDNSNLGASDPVAAMVVFVDGAPEAAGYRHYKITPLGKPDDYAAMAEVIRRRYQKGEAGKPWPDLLMVDGGRGQISVARAVLDELELTGAFDVAGIAKADLIQGETEDKIYLPGRANPVQFGRDQDLLLFLQRIRDEAHRWAVSFQRKRRTKRALHSELDDIPGVGPKRKALLLKHFGSVRKIRDATVEEIQSLPGISESAAQAIAAHFSFEKENSIQDRLA